MTITNPVELNTFIDRLCDLAEQANTLRLDARQVRAEAKAAGYNTKILRRIVADKRKDPNMLRDELENYDLYAHAAGLLREST